MRTLVTRKELSAKITELRGDKVTETQVRKNENRWGLRAARVADINHRVVRFELSKAIIALRLAGVVPLTLATTATSAATAILLSIAH